MEEQKTINVPMSTDEQGLFGRECPSCKKYFKLKPVTDFTATQGICPYCGYTVELQDFITQDQREYLESIAANEFLVPMLRDFANSLKGLETSSNDVVQFKVNTNIPQFPIRHYQEKVLETDVTCDTCGLVFSIYGVFSNCPACGKLNARVIYDRSLDVLSKKLALVDDETIDEPVRADFIKDVLQGSVSAFDALGKALRTKHPAIPAKPTNLFQNFLALDKVLATLTGKTISQFLTPADSDFLFLMFQVRHIYEHNAGVIDSDFVTKLPEYAHQLGRKYPLKKDDVNLFIVLMRQLGDAIYSEFEK